MYYIYSNNSEANVGNNVGILLSGVNRVEIKDGCIIFKFSSSNSSSSTVQDIMILNDITGIGIMDCKKAFQATDGNLDKAVDWLRENGLTTA